MSRWLKLLGSLMVWALHFVGLYTISSIADLYTSASDPVSRVIGVIFTLGCLGLVAAMAAWISRGTSREDGRRWERKLALAAAGVSALSIVWQAVPLAF